MFFVSAVLFVSAVVAAPYEVDSSHSNVDFEIRHLASKVRGNFESFNGKFSFDEKKPEALNEIEFTVDSKSIYTSNKKRDEHLKSADFFNVEKFPSIVFKSKKITAERKATKGAKASYTAVGDLTMLGKTKETTWKIDYLGTQPNMSGTMSSGFVASAKINRKDFDMQWNKTLDRGGVVLGDEVDLKINVEATPAASVAKN